MSTSRRSFIVSSMAAGGGLMLGIPLRLAEAAPAAGAVMAPNAFIRIDRRGAVTLILPYVEMGQGALTSQVQILAEELEVAPKRVIVEHAPADEKLYASPLLGGQITGGSASLLGSWKTMRTAGASARIMLIQTAAQRWKVDSADCVAVDGTVIHRASGRKIGYGELAADAAKQPVPKDPPLKAREAYEVIGKPVHRVDTSGKLDGKATFSIDVRQPNMRYAAVAASPVFNGKLASVDASEAMKVKGVSQVVKLDDAVAVVANNTWAAMKGLAALKIGWDDGANAGLSNADLVARADAALNEPGIVHLREGDVAKAEAGARARYEAVFREPALAHAAIEPMGCTVHVRKDGCDVWCGSQVVGRAAKVTAEATGLPLESVKVHNHLLGGGFGRRLETDFISQAALIAKQVNGPLKVTWSREEDMRHCVYRGINHSRVTVALDGAGRPLSWRHRVVGPNVMARFLPIYQKDGVDLDIVECAHGPYDIPNVHIEFTRHEAPQGMRTGNWRGVGPSRNVVIVESVMDDLAKRANADPIAYRLALMTKATPRLTKVLQLARDQSGWGQPLPARSGRGVAVFHAFGSFLALVAEAKVADNGEISVPRVTCVADIGLVVNPDIARAQLEGGIVFGISAALYGRITVAGGRVEQGNFDTYPVLRIHQAPQIDVHLVDSAEDPGGVGEPGTSGAIAAVANAVFAATGVRAYTLPLDPSQFKVTT
ncbi:xanthine dehydrogenase family protein molybdopterin-binding subunit [Duganella aceris]|uniref:Xanthine dehydrogenase family protein molybdopterin-binding subunit n=1 Tax=Duganella aceris TaxID=2703883 RepID=A0ABX0FRG4_9BURK|nr:molybdopterin cofactor-binding domain-containing protein [Duganella aceris]NGZ87052.1 xanthine dehydrogenase family protein molybdopterin-binding subunit [Duganella aceris]